MPCSTVDANSELAIHSMNGSQSIPASAAKRIGACSTNAKTHYIAFEWDSATVENISIKKYFKRIALFVL